MIRTATKKIKRKCYHACVSIKGSFFVFSTALPFFDDWLVRASRVRLD